MSSIQNKKEVLSLIQANRAKIMALGVERLGLFGSFVREEQTTASDIDLLVEFFPKKKFPRRGGISALFGGISEKFSPGGGGFRGGTK